MNTCFIIVALLGLAAGCSRTDATSKAERAPNAPERYMTNLQGNVQKAEATRDFANSASRALTEQLREGQASENR